MGDAFTKESTSVIETEQHRRSKLVLCVESTVVNSTLIDGTMSAMYARKIMDNC